MSQFTRDPFWSNVYQSFCKTCGMGVYVDGHPAPNGIDIHGEAVALNCGGIMEYLTCYRCKCSDKFVVKTIWSAEHFSHNECIAALLGKVQELKSKIEALENLVKPASPSG
jgi:hypothetical protein